MNFSRSEIEALASKMMDGSITASELERLNAWLNQQMAKDMVEVDTDFALNAEQLKDRMLRRIVERANADSTHHHRRRIRWVPYVAAAAVLVVAIIGTWIFVTDDGKVLKVDSSALLDNTDIPPGGSRATLTLTDGRTVNLSEMHTGIIVGEGIAYLDGSKVIDNERSENENASNSITTPKGGTYQITLPDGTHVWLNSASTLTYPLRFADDERVVELKGEAYFDVAGFPTLPFKVISERQTVEVLGTQFNIKTYEDEQDVKTTLVKGAVRVVPKTGHRSSFTLSPGQQSNLAGGKITVDNVDTSSYIAWKSGMFHFKQTPFGEMMRQIERWYDVDVEYSSRIPQETFSGRMSRNVSLMTVLDLLKVSGIRYRIRGKKLIIE